MVKITPDELTAFAHYIRVQSGISLDASKAYLLETRLSSMCQKLGCASFSELLRKIQLDRSGALRDELIDRITTSETLFFRDKHAFTLLKELLLPTLIKARRSTAFGPVPLRIWSAACSTGQEVYSLAIILQELLEEPQRRKLMLLGTDISNEAIARASRGRYNKFEVQRGLSSALLQRYFTPIDDQLWQVDDSLRAMVTFRQFNLMDSFVELGRFDLILCRNVAIYFALEDRKRLYQRLYHSLADDGYLLIGATESLTQMTSLFVPKRYQRAIYYEKRAPSVG